MSEHLLVLSAYFSMTEEYELSTYDRHELNHNQIALGRLPTSVIDDY